MEGQGHVCSEQRCMNSFVRNLSKPLEDRLTCSWKVSFQRQNIFDAFRENHVCMTSDINAVVNKEILAKSPRSIHRLQQPFFRTGFQAPLRRYTLLPEDTIHIK